MNQTLESLPNYLKKYCVHQEQDRYTARDHASWRYIMRQSREFFKDHALPIYLEGLKKTGISFDRIPLIEEMDHCLRTLGWGAVPVCGFIPPAAFLDFQARKILPIASDMRTVDHIAYTPAPDIVHEAAGHAPIIADPQYSEYLTMYAAMAQKVIFSKEDLDLYEAIRTLSDAKENPDSTPDMIAQAEKRLGEATKNVSFISEANKVARMNWWTVEYGLLGSLENPKIYGAGLLSSVGESQNCLSNKVEKIRLSVDCVETSYDITEPQPQLFVAEDIPHLCAVLKEFEQTLSYARGGTYGLDQALKGRTVTTSVLDSGLEISGKLTHYDADEDQVEFLKFEGPVQLAYQASELSGHGTAHHPSGFSTPLGRWRAAADQDPSKLSESKLRDLGIESGKRSSLEFCSGFKVEGNVAQVLRRDGQLIAIKWRDCTVSRAGQVYFEPAWGDFDMAVGTTVTSVYGGPSDREAYGSHDVGQASTSPGRSTPFSADELKAFEAYARLRRLREKARSNINDAQITGQALDLVNYVEKTFPREWLLRLECLELAHLTFAKDENGRERLEQIRSALLHDAPSFKEHDIRWLIEQGVQLAHVPD